MSGFSFGSSSARSTSPFPFSNLPSSSSAFSFGSSTPATTSTTGYSSPFSFSIRTTSSPSSSAFGSSKPSSSPNLSSFGFAPSAAAATAATTTTTSSASAPFLPLMSSATTSARSLFGSSSVLSSSSASITPSFPNLSTSSSAYNTTTISTSQFFSTSSAPLFSTLTTTTALSTPAASTTTQASFSMPSFCATSTSSPVPSTAATTDSVAAPASSAASDVGQFPGSFFLATAFSSSSATLPAFGSAFVPETTATRTTSILVATKGTNSNVSTTIPIPGLPSEITGKTVQKGLNSSCAPNFTTNAATFSRPAEKYSPTLEANILGSIKDLRDLVAAATAAIASSDSSPSTRAETLTNETKSMIQGFLGKDYACLADEGQRIKLRTTLQDLIKDNFFPPCVGPIFQGMLGQLENGVSAFQQAQTKFSDDKVLADKIKSSSNDLLSKLYFCNMKKNRFQELEVKKRRIEAEQARVLAEIEEIVEDTRPLQAQLQEFIRQHVILSEKNGDYQALIGTGEELWGSFKNMLDKYFYL